MKRLSESLNFLSDFTNSFKIETTTIYCIIIPSNFGLKTHKELARLFSKHYDMILRHKYLEIADFVNNRPNKLVGELVEQAIDSFSSAITLLSSQQRNSSEPLVICKPLVENGKFIENKQHIEDMFSLMQAIVKDLAIEYAN